MPYGSRTLEICFDFIDHKLLIETSEGEMRELPLKPQSVAEFYQIADEDVVAAGYAGQHLDYAL